MTEPFWRSRSLTELSHEEWESLCDNCGRCCLHKLEDVETGEVHYTSVVCRYLGPDCRCTDYENRQKLVPECEVLTPEQVEAFKWMPTTCAYRLVYEGKDLPEWHPLVTGDRGTVAQAGISVTGKAVSDEYVHPDDYETHIIRWVEH